MSEPGKKEADPTLTLEEASDELELSLVQDDADDTLADLLDLFTP